MIISGYGYETPVYRESTQVSISSEDVEDKTLFASQYHLPKNSRAKNQSVDRDWTVD